VEDAKSATRTEVPSDDDFEAQEALRSFQTYLDILREWDEKEQSEEENPSPERSMMQLND
jgi:hypothetical protein